MEPATFPKTPLRIVRALALIAVLCSGYLLSQKLSGVYDDCCGHVLDGRWSNWFGVPVSAFAIVIYATVLVVSLPAFAIPRAAIAGSVLRAASVMAAGAAIWFFAILLFVEKSSCPYCIATHLCGLSIAGIVFMVTGPRFPASGALPPAAGAIGVAVMIAGQLLSKPEGLDITSAGPGAPGGQTAAGVADGSINFTPQTKLHPDQFPTIGPEQPEHYLAELFDYTCKSCRSMYEDLKALMVKYPDTFAVIYLPTPLNRRCNMFLPSGVPDHEHACELARTSLAVWQADPSKFAAIHDYLMTTPLPIPPGDAEAKAISLVGEKAYRAAHASAAVNGTLATCFGHYGVLAKDNIRMPKLLLGGGKMVQGVAPSTAGFVSLMAQQFELDKAATSPAP